MQAKSPRLPERGAHRQRRNNKASDAPARRGKARRALERTASHTPQSEK